jgi:NagD protein
LPDCGAICALLESATGRRPDAVPGKPNRAMVDTVLKKYQLLPHQLVVVGDRLYTDVRMALEAGAISVLTLTGETKRGHLHECKASDRPDIVVTHLQELCRMIEKARNVG